ncbi:MAG TPA: alpha/beta fold hydrolase [Acidiferrobacterales bacterium]|nr:alpha/beta fold hydrolase [Acidiferrobacterales bacterium]
MSKGAFPCNQPITLAGPAGALEALTLCPAGEVVATAVLLHPHPLHGGTMHNKVVHTLARAFAELGVASVRFNFRGVGASAGRFAHGEGETEDALAVIEWARSRRPGIPIWLAGFSFGAYVALRAAAPAQVNGLITVAPAVHLYDFSTLTLPPCPWLLIQGEADEVVPVEAVHDWLSGITAPPQTLILPGVGHFFHGHLAEIKSALRDFVPQHLL